MPPINNEQEKQTTTEITLFVPGDGVTPNSNTCTYKTISNFKCNGDGTVEFDTVNYGHIKTAAMWRLKSPLVGDAVAPRRRTNFGL
jgi:hypothetical protein